MHHWRSGTITGKDLFLNHVLCTIGLRETNILMRMKHKVWSMSLPDRHFNIHVSVLSLIFKQHIYSQSEAWPAAKCLWPKSFPDSFSLLFWRSCWISEKEKTKTKKINKKKMNLHGELQLHYSKDTLCCTGNTREGKNPHRMWPIYARGYCQNMLPKTSGWVTCLTLLVLSVVADVGTRSHLEVHQHSLCPNNIRAMVYLRGEPTAFYPILHFILCHWLWHNKAWWTDL